jgi:PAS domain S-box-containing protein
MSLAVQHTMTESPLTVLTHLAMSLDALNCPAMLVGRTGTVAHVNPRLCELTGRRREDLVGSDLVSLYPAGDAQEVCRTLLADFDQSRETEFFLPGLGGTRVPVVVSARPVGRGSVLGEYAVVTLIDITRQKHAERQLQEQNDYIGELSDRVIRQATIMREYAGTLEGRVRERTAQLHEAHMETIYMLATASEAKDEDTFAHVRRVRAASKRLAERMGHGPDESERFGLAAVLHDVGKIHTPDLVLKKPGPLTADERQLMQQHTLAGERILRVSPYFVQASRIARSHHENWDGSGYPDGLAGADIPHEARLVHLVDVFDALTHRRVYKPAWDRRDAIAEVQANRGVMFDPDVVDAFLRMERDGDLERAADLVAAPPASTAG